MTGLNRISGVLYFVYAVLRMVRAQSQDRLLEADSFRITLTTQPPLSCLGSHSESAFRFTWIYIFPCLYFHQFN